MVILEADKLVKIYGGENGGCSTKALNRISFTIEKGEFVGIMGPSGSEETTLLNILSGIDKPTSEFVKISGKKINEMDKKELALF